MHVRAALRHAVGNALRAALPERKIFVGRWEALSAKQLPCILVITPSETTSQATRIGVVARVLTVGVIAVRSDGGTDDLDDMLDEDAAVIERVLAAPIDGVDLHLKSSDCGRDAVGDQGQPQQPIGRLGLTFIGQIHTKRGNPTSAL